LLHSCARPNQKHRRPQVLAEDGLGSLHPQTRAKPRSGWLGVHQILSNHLSALASLSSHPREKQWPGYGLEQLFSMAVAGSSQVKNKPLTLGVEYKHSPILVLLEHIQLAHVQALPIGGFTSEEEKLLLKKLPLSKEIVPAQSWLIFSIPAPPSYQDPGPRLPRAGGGSGLSSPGGITGDPGPLRHPGFLHPGTASWNTGLVKEVMMVKESKLQQVHKS